MGTLPGEHYCEKHQGNTSHYSLENCTLCRALKKIQSLEDEATAQKAPSEDVWMGPVTFAGKIDSYHKALAAIIVERDKQRDQWSPERDKKHDVSDWVTILAVYLGKLGYETVLYQGKGSFVKEKAKKRLVQISAIALAAVEALSSEAESTGTE